MYVSVWMCVYMSLCVCNIFVYKSIIKTTCDKISSTDSSSKQLYMTCGYITINKTNKTNKTNIHSGGRWAWSVLLEIQSKNDYWNPRNSRSGHQRMSFTTWITIFNWSPYLQIQNVKLNLSNFNVTSPFNKLYMHWLVFFSGVN